MARSTRCLRKQLARLQQLAADLGHGIHDQAGEQPLRQQLDQISAVA